MAQTKPKAAQFYGVSGDGTAGQVLISDGNGGMFWGANTENYTVSWNTPTGQSLTYTQPTPQSSSGSPGSAFPTTTFTVTKSDTIISGTATIAGLPTGVTATQVITGSGIGNTLTVTLSGVFPGADSLNTDLTLSGLTLSKTVSWATPTGQSLTYTQPSPQSSTGNPGTTFPTTTFTATKSGEEISGTATIAGLPTGITATQSLSGTGVDNVLTVTLTGVFPGADSLNTALTLSGLTVALPLIVDYLVVAGGGGGGSTRSTSGGGGGGGAGGYRSSVTGESSGGGAAAESSLTLTSGASYAITIGSGGVGGPVSLMGTSGNNSVFHTITSIGGGAGGGGTTAPLDGLGGGSGGGGSFASSAGAGTANQGYIGGSSTQSRAGAGGGGASSKGTDITQSGYPYPVNGTAGGFGVSSAITGTSIARAGGGGGGADNTSGGGAAVAGGGAGGNNSIGVAGTPNTGGGGGGAGSYSIGSAPEKAGAAGGSGIVILRYPNSYTISGLSGTTITVGTDKVTTFTNVGTGNIQFN